jgi:hypothetical protein
MVFDSVRLILFNHHAKSYAELSTKKLWLFLINGIVANQTQPVPKILIFALQFAKNNT